MKIIAGLGGVLAALGLLIAASQQPVVPTGSSLPETIDVRSFGVKGDGVSDDAPGINAAIAACQKNPRAKVVQLPAGRFRIASPILIVPRNRGEQPSVSLIGVDFPSELASQGRASVILPTFRDQPAIIVQRGRGVHLANLVIHGMNHVQESLMKNYPFAQSKLLKEENFIESGSRDSRYSPYCGIAIDPFKTTVASDGGYPNLKLFYSPETAGGSSNLLLENIEIRDFVVGLMLSPSGENANTSEITIQNVRAFGCKCAFACGGNQARNVSMRRCSAGAAFIGWDGCRYGDRRGNPPRLNDCDAGACAYLFCFPGEWGQVQISGFYCEGCLSLGWFCPNFATSTMTANISGCDFNLTASDEAATPDFTLFSMMNTTFTGCTFTTDYPARFANLNGALNFVGCVFLSPKTTSSDNPVILQDYGATLIGCNARKDGAGQFVLPAHLAKPTRLISELADFVNHGDGTATFEATGTVLANDTVIAEGAPLDVLRPSETAPLYNWRGVLGQVAKVEGKTVTLLRVPVSVRSGSYRHLVAP